MTDYCQYALKDWSVTVDSLRAGQILLLRKGGIHEQYDEFHVKYSEFFLFPTELHQSLPAIHPSFHSLFQESADPDPATVTLDTYAEVRELIPISSLDTLRALDGMHTLGWKAVEQRFFYRNRPGLNLLLLRVYRLTIPHQIENLERYGGCTSWVKLEKSLSTAGSEPVLSGHLFERQRDEIRRLTGSGSLTTAVKQTRN